MGILSWFSSSKSNTPTQNDHAPRKKEDPLLPAVVVSAHNELIKIQNDTVYEIYYIPERNEFLVKTDALCRRFLETGKLIEEFWGDAGAHPCGASFYADGFVDWALTKNPKIQPFADTVDLDNADPTDMIKRLRQSSGYHRGEEKSQRLFYIKEGHSWVKVTHNKKYDDSRFGKPPISATPLIKLERNEPHWELLQFTQDNPAQQPASGSNKKQRQGDVGIACVALPYGDEILHCRLHIVREATDTREKKYLYDAAIYSAPLGQAQSDSAQFVQLYTRILSSRPREEQGLYVIRRKTTPHQQESKDHILGLKYLGDTTASVCWQAIHYPTAASEFFDDSHSGTLAERKRQAPKTIDLTWHSTTIRPNKTPTLFQCNNTFFTAKQPTSLCLDLTKSNLTSALKQLNASTPVYLSLESQAVGGGFILQLSVSSEQQSLYLQNYAIKIKDDKTQPENQPPTTTHHEFVRNALPQLLTHTDSRIAFYVQYALSLQENFWQKLAAEHAYPLAEVMHTALAQGDMDTACRWFTVFDRCLSPHLKEHTALLEFVAADMVVVAIEKAQAPLYEKVRERLLSNKPADRISDARLLFNMACYAARTNNKPALLELTRQALTKGKSKSDFSGDKDFAQFQNDSEFARLMKEKSPTG